MATKPQTTVATTAPTVMEPRQTLELKLAIDAELYATAQLDNQWQPLLTKLSAYFEFIPLSSDSNQPLTSTICGAIYSATCAASVTKQRQLLELLHQSYSLLPCVELQHLDSGEQLAHFIPQVLAFNEWLQFQQRFALGNDSKNTPATSTQSTAEPLSGKVLIDIHSRYKYLVMAHSLAHYKSMGRLLGNLRIADLGAVATEYFQQLMTALAIPATRKTHSNTLMHIQGYLKTVLSSVEKAELTELIHQYRTELVPLSAPLNLLKQHFHQHPAGMGYMLEQVYLTPHPLVLDSGH